MECEWKGYVQLPSLIHRNILCWISASSEPLFTFLPPALCFGSLTGNLSGRILDSGWVESVGDPAGDWREGEE